MHTNKHPRLHTKPTSCMTYCLMPHTYSQKISPGDRLLSLRVCDAVTRRSQTNRGNPLCLAMSITGHLTIPMYVDVWKPSPQPPQPGSKTNRFIQHASTNTCTAPLAPGMFPWRRDTQTGSLRSGLWQFSSLRTLQVWPSLDQAASFSSISP